MFAHRRRVGVLAHHPRPPGSRTTPPSRAPIYPSPRTQHSALRTFSTTGDFSKPNGRLQGWFRGASGGAFVDATFRLSRSNNKSYAKARPLKSKFFRAPTRRHPQPDNSRPTRPSANFESPTDSNDLRAEMSEKVRNCPTSKNRFSIPPIVDPLSSIRSPSRVSSE